jgi:hypothetical protein
MTRLNALNRTMDKKLTLYKRTLRRTVLDVNKFLLQLRDRMIGRLRAGNGRRPMIPRLNP